MRIWPEYGLRPERFGLCYHLDRAWRCGLGHAANFEEEHSYA
jgi:hypothetical protein